MTAINYNNKLKFLLISLISFIASIGVVNLAFYYTNNSEISAKITIVLLFCMNLYLFLKYYKLKGDKKKFPILFLFFSIFFRLFEYYIFIFLVNYLNSLNIAWIMALAISFMCKFLFFDKLFSNS